MLQIWLLFVFVRRTFSLSEGLTPPSVIAAVSPIKAKLTVLSVNWIFFSNAKRSLPEWKDGYLVVDYLGKVKGQYEDYIDMPHILKNLYMDPDAYLCGLEGVTISYD